MNRKKTIRRRRLSAVVAVVTAMALLVGGTFAWQSIRQRAVNNSGGTPEEPGGRLHDDFMELQEFLTPENGNKDVYVENFSGPTEVEPDAVGRPMFVRVRFTEYMEIGEGAGLYTVDPVGVDPIDYQDLDKVGTGGEGRTEDTNNHAESVIDTVPATPTPSVSPAPPGPTEPSILDLDTWHIHTPDPEVSDDGSDLHYYWDWTMGGSKIYMPTFNMDNESLLTDRTEYEHEQFTAGETMTETEYYKDGETSSAPVTHTAQSTLMTEDVITMDEWMNLGRPIENTDTGHAYWVADEDGWFYWSRALQPGNATGLLLDGITMVREPDAQWYYGIHVISEMASAGDWGDNATGTGFYEEGISNNALFLLNQAADLQPQVRSISIEEGRRVYVNAGSAINLNAKLSVDNTSGDAGESLVTWSVDPATADSQLDRTDADSAIFRTTDEDEGNIFTITATSPELEGSEVKSDSIQVIVIPSDAVGVVGPQANTSYYVDYGDNTFRELNNDGMISDEWRCAGSDEVIGNGDDILNVTVNAAGVKMIGPSAEDGSYQVDGSINGADVETDGKLAGTADDDVKKWPSPDIDHMGNSPFTGLAVGETYTDIDGNEWQVIHKDEDGNSLVMLTTLVNRRVQYNLTNEWTPLEESNLMTGDGGLSDFYTDDVGNDVKYSAVPHAEFNDARTASGGEPLYSRLENIPQDRTTPDVDDTPAANGSDTVFILSVSEFNEYNDNMVIEVQSRWWLRSAGPDSIGAEPTGAEVTGVYTIERSTIAGRANLVTMPYRPALWIKE